MDRALRHGLIAATVVVLVAIAAVAGPRATALDRLSLLTAWLCLAFLGAALSIGAWRRRTTRRPLLNYVPRRDLGIWAGLTGLAHVLAATGVVMTPAYFRAYITGPEPSALPGWAGWTGTAAIVAGYVLGLQFLLLLALSSDRALRRLGPERWKRYQHWAWPMFLVTVAHGVVFQVIEGRTGAWLVVLVAVALAVTGYRRLAG
jgi:sulfoxide reductase heme-binding subunit YedZ